MYKTSLSSSARQIKNSYISVNAHSPCIFSTDLIVLRVMVQFADHVRFPINL